MSVQLMYEIDGTKGLEGFLILPPLQRREVRPDTSRRYTAYAGLNHVPVEQTVGEMAWETDIYGVRLRYTTELTVGDDRNCHFFYHRKLDIFQ